VAFDVRESAERRLYFPPTCGRRAIKKVGSGELIYCNDVVTSMGNDW